MKNEICLEEDCDRIGKFIYDKETVYESKIVDSS